MSKAASGKKRAPLRHVSIEKSMEGPSRKRRATASSPAGKSAESGSDEEENMETAEVISEEIVTEGSVKRASSAKESSRLKEQAREQRRDIFSEELSARGGGMAQTAASAVAAAKFLHDQVRYIMPYLNPI